MGKKKSVRRSSKLQNKKVPSLSSLNNDVQNVFKTVGTIPPEKMRAYINENFYGMTIKFAADFILHSMLWKEMNHEEKLTFLLIMIGELA